MGKKRSEMWIIKFWIYGHGDKPRRLLGRQQFTHDMCICSIKNGRDSIVYGVLRRDKRLLKCVGKKKIVNFFKLVYILFVSIRAGNNGDGGRSIFLAHRWPDRTDRDRNNIKTIYYNIFVGRNRICVFFLNAVRKTVFFFFYIYRTFAGSLLLVPSNDTNTLANQFFFRHSLRIYRRRHIFAIAQNVFLLFIIIICWVYRHISNAVRCPVSFSACEHII